MEVKVVGNKITSLTYKRDASEWAINVDSFCIRRNSQDSNPGTIIETYRDLRKKGRSECAEYLSSNRQVIEDYINRLTNSIQDKPDYIQVFETGDKERNRIIDSFKLRMISTMFSNELPPDYSKYFTKQNKDISVRDMAGSVEDKAKNFSFTKPEGLNSIKTLWVIDDTIDTGATIEIFLNSLYDNGLLDKTTTIYCFILYNNLKKDSAFKGLTIEGLKKRLSE